jgi:hypothetical protein
VDVRAALRDFLTPNATKSQYLYGVQDETRVAPEAYTLDSALPASPGNDEIQLDLFLDYASNVALYPKFQEYFRTKQRPLLAVWGKSETNQPSVLSRNFVHARLIMSAIAASSALTLEIR